MQVAERNAMYLEVADGELAGTKGERNADGAECTEERALVTLLFSDIVGSTRTAADLGDHRWVALLLRFRQVVQGEIARFHGQDVDTSGDGFLAAFYGPARAIQCACSIVAKVRAIGLELRSGLHTGECEVSHGRFEGISVHIGARIAALAEPGEILVSRTLRDVVVGSDLSFKDRGLQILKGVAGERRVFAVAMQQSEDTGTFSHAEGGNLIHLRGSQPNRRAIEA